MATITSREVLVFKLHPEFVYNAQKCLALGHATDDQRIPVWVLLVSLVVHHPRQVRVNFGSGDGVAFQNGISQPRDSTSQGNRISVAFGTFPPHQPGAQYPVLVPHTHTVIFAVVFHNQLVQMLFHTSKVRKITSATNKRVFANRVKAHDVREASQTPVRSQGVSRHHHTVRILDRKNRRSRQNGLPAKQQQRKRKSTWINTRTATIKKKSYIPIDCLTHVVCCRGA